MTVKIFRVLMIILLMLILGVNVSFGCTNLLVSKGASEDGSVMITYTADMAGFYARLQVFPAAEYEADAVIEIPATKERETATIKQVAKTNQVLGVVWDGNHLDRQGCINEFQVAIAETTFVGHENLVNPQALIGYSHLITLALERSKTAREAIDVMVQLVEEYGFNDYGESISVADKEEAWVFEIVGTGPGPVSPEKRGAVWVARKVPDGEISAHANVARIGEIPEKCDPDNFFYSDNIKSFAVEKGLYDLNSDKPFRFDDVYGNTDAKSKRACESRVWSIFRRAAPSQESRLSADYHRDVEGAEPYPWSIRPDKKLSTADVMALMRDHFEGTEFDMTQGFDAGAFGLPRRWHPLFWKVDGVEYSWERPISTQQTGFSIVTQSRASLPDAVGGVLWYGVDDTYLTCYFPLYCGITEVPASYACGGIERFSSDSAWWIFNFVSNYANLKFSAITPDILAVQAELETKFLALQSAVELTATELMKTNPKLAQEYLTDYSVMQAEKVTNRWKKLAVDLITKFNDGYIRDREGKPQKIGYPEPWLRKVLQERPEQFKLPPETKQPKE